MGTKLEGQIRAGIYPDTNPVAVALVRALLPRDYTVAPVVVNDYLTDVFVAAQYDVHCEDTLDRLHQVLSQIQEDVEIILDDQHMLRGSISKKPFIDGIDKYDRPAHMTYGVLTFPQANLRVIFVPHGDSFLPHVQDLPGTERYKEAATGITQKKLKRTLRREGL